MPICIKIGKLVFKIIVFTSLVTNDKRTNERTRRVDWRRHKNCSLYTTQRRYHMSKTAKIRKGDITHHHITYHHSRPRRNTAITYRNSSVDEIGERYRLNHPIVVKLYYPCTQFPRNVRLSHRRTGTFSQRRDFFDYSAVFCLIFYLLIYLLTYLLGSFFVVDNICGSFINNTYKLKKNIRRLIYG